MIKKCVCGRKVIQWRNVKNKSWLILCELCDLQISYCKCKSIDKESSFMYEHD